MKNYKHIEFNCLEENCNKIIVFQLPDIEKNPVIRCPHCKKEYTFNGGFVNKMKKFDALISAIRDAKEILGDTHVAINVKNEELRIPYRLLLTRMNTVFALMIGNKRVEFKFRVEPLADDGVNFKTSG